MTKQEIAEALEDLKTKLVALVNASQDAEEDEEDEEDEEENGEAASYADDVLSAIDNVRSTLKAVPNHLLSQVCARLVEVRDSATQHRRDLINAVVSRIHRRGY